MKSAYGCGFGLVLFGMLLVSPPPAHAHKRDFVWTYEWFTAAQGEKEVELWATDVPEENEFEAQVEFEYGVTDRWSVAPYAIFEKGAGDSFDLKGWKLEQRYRVGEFKEKRLLPAAYLEVKKEQDEPYELEAKAIFSRLSGDTNLALNLIAEKKLTAGEDTEIGYAMGASKNIAPKLRGTIEAFGNFKDPKHAIGPGLAYDIAPNQRLNINAGFGLNDRTDDLVVRVVYEFEMLPD